MKTWENVRHRVTGRVGRVVDIDWASQTAEVLWNIEDDADVTETVGFNQLTTKEEP